MSTGIYIISYDIARQYIVKADHQSLLYSKLSSRKNIDNGTYIAVS